jgi:hypothetical protein
LADALPKGATLLSDKAYISRSDAASLLAESSVRLIAQVRENLQPLDWWDDFALRTHRLTIDTVNSQLEKWQLNVCMRAPTQASFSKFMRHWSHFRSPTPTSNQGAIFFLCEVRKDTLV